MCVDCKQLLPCTGMPCRCWLSNTCCHTKSQSCCTQAVSVGYLAVFGLAQHPIHGQLCEHPRLVITLALSTLEQMLLPTLVPCTVLACQIYTKDSALQPDHSQSRVSMDTSVISMVQSYHESDIALCPTSAFCQNERQGSRAGGERPISGQKTPQK